MKDIERHLEAYKLHLEGKTFTEVGAVIGVTASLARQMYLRSEQAADVHYDRFDQLPVAIDEATLLQTVQAEKANVEEARRLMEEARTRFQEAQERARTARFEYDDQRWFFFLRRAIELRRTLPQEAG